MKSLFTAVAIVLTVTVFGQLRVSYSPISPSGGNIALPPNNFLFGENLTTESNQIIIGTKKKPISTSVSLYTFWLNGDKQTQRNGDTLTVHDKTIRFIVIDGVMYEVVRSTEVKKVDMQPLRFYSNGITVTPNYLYPNKN